MGVSLKGLGSIKGLLLAHGEKVGVAIVGVCAGLFVYSSLTHDPLPDQYQAPQLRREVEQARNEVQEFKWTEASQEDVRHARPFAKGEIATVPPEAYGISPHGWDRPVVHPTVLRTDPVLLAAVDLEVYGGSGLLAFQDDALERQKELEAKAEQAREEAERQEQLKREQDDRAPGRGGGRDRGDFAERGRFGGEEVDPKHPHRRALDSSVRPPGVPLSGVERVEAAHWAVVVAKVPIKEQLKLYRDALENARSYDPEADFPQYMGYYVQRTEVRPGQPPDWQRVSVYDGQSKNIRSGKRIAKGVVEKVLAQVVEDWAEVAPEVVDSRFFDPNYVLPFPLPPLVGRDWGEDVTHSDIPLAEDDPGLDRVKTRAEPEDQATPAVVEEADLFSSRDDQGGSRRGPSGRPGAYPGSRGSLRGSMYGTSRGAASLRGGMSRFDLDASPEIGYGGRSRGGRGGRGGYRMLARDVPYWLLRFFDFNVEPGKKYQYRIKLALSDVNDTSSSASGRILPKDALDSTVLDRQKEKKKVLFTDWSGPSPTVGIPLSGDVLIADAKGVSEKLSNDEPSVAMLVRSFSVGEDGQAFQAAKKEDGFRRGSVANMTDDVEIITEGNRYIDLVKSFDFRTGITVVDIRGGERLTKDFSAPAKVLLMDPTGQLSVRNELDDFDEVDQHRLLFEKSDRRGGRGPGDIRGGRGDPFGGRGPYGGGAGNLDRGRGR